ncbi:MAG: ArsR family transcriptional regulator [Bacteroidales bacterium]|nr:ArsR family transcriptional regulator [Bacteroidales bacterium]
MLETLITSKTRIKLMVKFFLNSSTTGYLRGLESEFGESTNAIRLELNRFEAAGLLHSFFISNRKVFKANKKHPLFKDINSLVRKYVGMDDVIEQIVNHLGNPEEVYLSGELAGGQDSDEINLIIIADKIDMNFLIQLCKKAQTIITRKIRYVVYTKEEFEQQLNLLDEEKLLLIWKNMN